MTTARSQQTITVRVPLNFRKRGGRKVAIAADGSAWAAARPHINTTLVKAIARAHRWSKLLECGRYSSAAELAAAEKINPSYVSRILRLTLLSPNIVEAIVNGRETTDIEADVLLKPFPVDWHQQQHILRCACSYNKASGLSSDEMAITLPHGIRSLTIRQT